MAARIYSRRLYTVQRDSGISGFPGPPETVLMRGDKVRALYLARPRAEFHAADFPGATWRLDNGRYPDLQPRATSEEAAATVAAEGSTAVLLDGGSRFNRPDDF